MKECLLTCPLTDIEEAELMEVVKQVYSEFKYDMSMNYYKKLYERIHILLKTGCSELTVYNISDIIDILDMKDTTIKKIKQFERACSRVRTEFNLTGKKSERYINQLEKLLPLDEKIHFKFYPSQYQAHKAITYLSEVINNNPLVPYQLFILRKNLYKIVMNYQRNTVQKYIK